MPSRERPRCLELIAAAVAQPSNSYTGRRGGGLCTETAARGRNRYRRRNRFLLRHLAGFASTQASVSPSVPIPTATPIRAPVSSDFVCEAGAVLRAALLRTNFLTADDPTTFMQLAHRFGRIGARAATVQGGVGHIRGARSAWDPSARVGHAGNALVPIQIAAPIDWRIARLVAATLHAAGWPRWRPAFAP